MSEIKAIIFDLDGVLTNTSEYHYRGWQQLADELGIPFDRQRNELLRGVPRRRSLELILDGRAQMSRAFFLPMEWEDVTLRAKFLVEPAEKGVLACGFVVRAQDAVTYYYVHFDRAQAILVRSDENVS